MKKHIDFIIYLEKVVSIIFLLISTSIFSNLDVCYGQSSNCNFLCNSNFESPGTVPVSSYGLLNQINIPCWKTTATDSMIEVWGSGFLGVNAYSGNNFIELNAYQVSTLYQNFTAPLGATTQISFAHRGRNGVDVMSVSIGPVGGPFTTLGTFSAGPGSWTYNTVNYTFPIAGSQIYSLRFNSISAAGNSQSIGNFLDAITVTYPSPDIDFIINEPTCNFASDGSIEAILTGGSAPYVYNWTPASSINSNALLNLPVGNYSLTVTDFYGCTATENVQLTASQDLIVMNFTDTLCQGQVYVGVNGNIIDQSGVYIDTISNSQCEAVYIQNVTILENDTTYLQSTICQGDSLFFGSTYLNLGGVYENILQNLNGCDSIVMLNLIVNPSYNLVQNVTACDSFFWNGQNYTTSGQFNFLTNSENGCDSLVTLNLTINPSYNIVQNISACESYYWNGQSYSTSGQYTYLTFSEKGCDSLVTLNLTINHSITTVQNISSCDSYSWNGQTLNTSGQYNYVLSNQQGCDSITVLNLQINQSEEYFDTVWVCDESEVMTTSTTFQNSTGCDSIFILNYVLVPYEEQAQASFQIGSQPNVIIINQDYQLINQSLFSDVFSWFFGFNNQWSTEFSPSISISEPGQYSIMLIANNISDCPDTMSLNILVVEDLNVYVPNSFTPDGNSFNNIFLPIISGDIDSNSYSLQIFNRWGNIVFESYNIYEGWDGTYKFNDVQDGVYTWRIKLKSKSNNSRKEFTGHVVVLH